MELCPPSATPTLGQLDRSVVLSRTAPERAVTLLDFERLALDVPGARVLRARAWAGIRPYPPDQAAPGFVTLVIVPQLPPGRPQPSPGLLSAVQSYLDRRRAIGARLAVVGPRYLDIDVRAEIRTRADAKSERVRADVVAALRSFLDPVRGGPDGRGWPFGRDVYRSEILQVIDEVPDVDHVLSLSLSSGETEPSTDNVSVGRTCLVALGSCEVDSTQLVFKN